MMKQDYTKYAYFSIFNPLSMELIVRANQPSVWGTDFQVKQLQFDAWALSWHITTFFNIKWIQLVGSSRIDAVN